MVYRCTLCAKIFLFRCRGNGIPQPYSIRSEEFPVKLGMSHVSVGFLRWTIHDIYILRGRYNYGRKPEKPQKSGGNRKREMNSAENRKNKCARNRKMTFLSHGKPENLKISVENGTSP